MTVTVPWLEQKSFPRKPVVMVEDHVYHFDEVVGALSGSDLLNHMTLVCLDRSGPDTSASVIGWLKAHHGLQVAARMSDETFAGLEPWVRERCLQLDDTVFSQQHTYCKNIARLLRPRGILVQDIQLETLSFVSEEDWWETIFLASTVRGMLPQGPPACRFMSNKSGFGISFGRELLEAGFDPRDVIDKNDLCQIVGEVIHDYLHDAFPFSLEMCRGECEPVREWVGPEDRVHLAEYMDLLMWDRTSGFLLEGKRFAKAIGKGGSGRPGQQEIETWKILVQDFLEAGSGLEVDAVGARVAPEGALRAERTNVAARHLHTLRSRLKDPSAILTHDGNYLLDRNMVVGKIEERDITF